MALHKQREFSKSSSLSGIEVKSEQRMLLIQSPVSFKPAMRAPALGVSQQVAVIPPIPALPPTRKAKLVFKPFRSNPPQPNPADTTSVALVIPPKSNRYVEKMFKVVGQKPLEAVPVTEVKETDVDMDPFEKYVFPAGIPL